MLKHEPQEPAAQSAVPTAAQVRVTPEELNAALTALEADKQQAARLQAGTVPIGEIVDELHLDATPEQIWAQVQKQRAQEESQRIQEERRRAQEEAARISQSASVQSVVRPRRLRWHRRWWLFFGISWAIYGITQGNLFPSHPVITNPGQAITINGNLTRETISAQGKDIVINGDFDTITLQGQARSVTVSGDVDTLRGDAPRSYMQDGDLDNAKWTSAP